MEFNFDSIISGAKGLLDMASVKAGEAIDYSKAQIDKGQLNIRLREKYTALGKAYYAEKMSGADKSDIMGKLVDEITEIKDKLGTASPKNNRTCTQCGNICTSDVSFCGKCGARLDV